MAAATSRGVGGCPSSRPLTTLANTELSTAVPTEPPTCCMVFTIADATPASSRATPCVAVAMAGATMLPNPTPMTSRAGSTSTA